MQDDDEEFVSLQDLLETSDLFAWTSKLPRARPVTSDPLKALELLLDFYMEVHDAANLYGQCMVVAVDMFHDPTIQTLPVTLSDAEHSRIACALWVIKIYRQLRHYRDFTNDFMNNLKSWQIEQAVSIETKLQMDEDSPGELLDYSGPMNAGLLERLLQSPYVKNVIMVSIPLDGPGSTIHDFSFAASFMRRRTNVEWLRAGFEAGCDAELSSLAIQLRNHVWTSQDLTMHTTPRMRSKRYRNLCRHLGLYFWDYDRLADWQIADADDLMAAANDAYVRALPLDLLEDESLLCRERLNVTERRKERQIIEWTRGPGIDTLEDWLWQRTAAFWLERGMSALPRNAIIPGTRCSRCGLDGHWNIRCSFQHWQCYQAFRGL